MKLETLENKIANCYISLLMKDKNVDFSLENIALKSKVNMDEILPLLPYEEKINHLYLMRIFLDNLDKKVLHDLYDIIIDEEISFYEKILEGFFLRFENLFQYRKAIQRLSEGYNKRLKNFNFLFLNNHSFLLKLLKLSGDKDNYLKINARALFLQSIYLKALEKFLKEDQIILEQIMRIIDDDLKKVFEINVFFRNFL